MKYAIKPIRIAPCVRLGANGYDEWLLRRDGFDRTLCEEMEYALDFAALHLRSAEAVAIAVSARLNGYPAAEEFDLVAIRKLIDSANRLWTFRLWTFEVENDCD